jgi:hypothetical protein
MNNDDNAYREVFKPDPGQSSDPGRVFYTITAEDTGKRHIRTTAGTIDLAGVIGYVLAGDIGKRLYRVPNNAGDWWFWQCESNRQRDARIAKAARLRDELTAIRETTHAVMRHLDD